METRMHTESAATVVVFSIEITSPSSNCASATSSGNLWRKAQRPNLERLDYQPALCRRLPNSWISAQGMHVPVAPLM